VVLHADVPMATSSSGRFNFGMSSVSRHNDQAQAAIGAAGPKTAAATQEAPGAWRPQQNTAGTKVVQHGAHEQGQADLSPGLPGPVRDRPPRDGTQRCKSRKKLPGPVRPMLKP
jgi:hypothetical protein